MTTEHKIEQMIMLSLRPWNENGKTTSVTSLNDVHKKLIEELSFVGICLFADNITSTAKTVAFTSEIQQAAMNSDTGIMGDPKLVRKMGEETYRSASSLLMFMR